MGPKGLYGLERLLANLAPLENAPEIEIHLFNRTESFGAGEVYDPEQPAYLLMNYANGHISMWHSERIPAVVPTTYTLVEWLKKNHYPASGADDVSPRFLVGKYLQEGFEALVKHAPKFVKIYKHVGEVADIAPLGNRYTLTVSTDGSQRRLRGIDEILVASGHPRVQAKPFPDLDHSVDFVYPIPSKLAKINPGELVAMKGLGLTFVDAVLGLTEGRGGRFSENSQGDLVYSPSGKEPQKIFPFSKSGLPMMPRGNTYPPKIYEPIFFTQENLTQGRNPSTKYDFEKEVLPWMEREYKWVYYSKLLRINHLTLEPSADFSEIEAQIEDFHRLFPKFVRFDLQDFLHRPFTEEGLVEDRQAYVDYCLGQAKLGEEKSPLAGAAGLWRSLSPVFARVYQFGGLRPESHRLFAEQYAGALNRLSYGPPIGNMEKILALAKNGLLDFSAAKGQISYRIPLFRLQSEDGRVAVETDYFVDARIPKYQVSDTSQGLYGKMIERGILTPYVNREGERCYQPGCVALSQAGHAIDPSGRINDSITFTGTPTEGLTYDNDSLSREKNDLVSAWARNLCERLEKKAKPIRISESKTPVSP